MKINPLYKRLVWLVLFLLPGDSLVTRYAVIRAGVWMGRQGGELTRPQRKRLIARTKGTVKLNILCGVGIMALLVQHPIVFLMGMLLAGFGCWSGVVILARWLMGA